MQSVSLSVKDFYKKYFQIDKPYEFQERIWDLIFQGKNPLLVRAPTGSGKTEAAIAPFLAQFVDNEFPIAPRLIYVLPIRVLVNSIAQRIKKYAERISPNISVEIQHGDIPDSPFFIADIVVTTLDQFLYGFARASRQVGHHMDVPAGSIATSIVVFDEAHMYRDEFTFSIMRALMEILYRSNIPFVVMTATMPKSLEESLFERIELSDEQKIFVDIPFSSKIDIKLHDNPLISNEDINLSDDLLEKIKTKKTLIVLNQVKRAQKVYEKIRSRLELSDEQIVLLHSRFTKVDRIEHEGKAFSLIPHKENGEIIIPEGTGIVVSTQVLEAGIDFSAELLLTELAPADSLVQRAGRCARYEGQSGEMIVFQVDDVDRGYLPYEKESLDKTWEWLKDNPDFNIKNSVQVCQFVDNILNYKANDYEAADTLIDLYECVLYADTEPRNIQLREGKPITIVVVDFSIGEGRKKEDRIKNAIKNVNVRENSMNLDIGIGRSLRNKEILSLMLKYDPDKKEWTYEEVREIVPFRMYILDSNYYDKKKGVIPDDSIFI
ncbi:CRISPR-associated helicase Cas3' [Thermodesulfobacterium hveragerdense]|uniref:CRISPR-associated helicase Cas3' n=1 Tax=Thermodesulfobacterium hveragerdense TaxID=53424 RepID=UPI0003FC19F9|nr:CRISPR-associated helicase Cas3' [Thermodesulfobacterium hveragerdense]